MRLKIISFITALSICFSSLISPFFSVNVLAAEAAIPWPLIFEFIAESLGSWAITKTADYTVDQLIGSGRKMTYDEYSSASNDWDNCVKYMKSQGCSDSDIINLQNQIRGGDLDFSSKVGQALENYFAQKNSNTSGQWDNVINHSVIYPTQGLLSKSYIMRFVDQIGKSNRGKDYLTNRYFNLSTSDNLEDKAIALVPYTSTIDNGYTYIAVYGKSSLDSSDSINLVNSNMIGYFRVWTLGNGDWCMGYVNQIDHYFSVNVATSIFSGYSNNDNLNNIGLKSDIIIPNRISSNSGSLPHYFDNTIDNVDSSKNTYDNTPATIDWSKIFDSDDVKNPTFRKIDGYTPPAPTIKDDGSNYDEVVNQLKETNSKLAKILGWLQNFDYDNSGKIKDYRLSPIEPNTPLFNFKLHEKFPFSLPWDMLAILSILKAKPIPPKIDIPILLPDSKGNVKDIQLSDDKLTTTTGDKITIDFSGDTWQKAAKILRLLELLLFIIGMAVLFWKYGK